MRYKLPLFNKVCKTSRGSKIALEGEYLIDLGFLPFDTYKITSPNVGVIILENLNITKGDLND